jgi:SAM-dependent methyltransferase
MPEFTSRDPQSPAFWDERFAQGYTPWDKGGVPQALRDFAAARTDAPVTLIPGCGAAYEAHFLLEAGWDVTAIDFSPRAVAAARAGMGPWADRIVEADFFACAPPRAPQLIYERAFLCALPRAQWPAIAARYAALLPAGGLLAGFFYLGDTRKGPPFGAAPGELEALLEPYFVREQDAPVADSLAVFGGHERWQVWRRL